MDTNHKITLQKSTEEKSGWKVVSKISLTAQIPEESLLLREDALEQEVHHGTMVQLIPMAGGVETYCSILYPTKIGEEAVVGYQRTTQRQLFDEHAVCKRVVLPHTAIHWKHVKLLLFVDEGDHRPHRVLDEIYIAQAIVKSK